jgi:hypothetical protein
VWRAPAAKKDMFFFKYYGDTARTHGPVQVGDAKDGTVAL